MFLHCNITHCAFLVRLSPPDVAIPKTTFTTAHVQWTDIGVKADNYTVRLSPVDSVDGGDEKACYLYYIGYF